MEMKNNMTVTSSGMVIAAILVGSFSAINTVRQAITSGNATSHNATSSAASDNATTADNKTSGGGSQGAS